MRTSLEVADIFRAAGPAYRVAHAGHLGFDQLKVMSAIEHCRTAIMGGHVEAFVILVDSWFALIVSDKVPTFHPAGMKFRD